MGILDIFRKKAAPKEYRLPFPYTLLPAGQKAAEYRRLWEAARQEAGQPVLLLLEDSLLDILEENRYSPGPLPDIDKFLAERYKDEPEDMLEACLGQPGDTCHIPTEFGIFEAMKNTPVALAAIPAEAPWDIFKALPIGGWNECPPPEYIAAFCKKLYDRYGAVPAVISGDTLELVAQRLPEPQEALELARDMFLFCPDLVIQGTESLYALADSLTKSPIWYFWWD